MSRDNSTNLSMSRSAKSFYTYLSPKELADMFDVIEEDDEHMTEYLSEMRPGYAADMLAEMYTDNAVDLLNTLDIEASSKNI